jgi:hypothetical protein
MLNYFFIITSLPKMDIGSPAEMNFEEFNSLIKNNLTKNDYKQTQLIRFYYDIQNIRLLWLGHELDPYGNLDAVELESALSRSGLPNCVYAFLEQHESLEERLQNFPALISAFFREEFSRLSPFLRKYLEFERGAKKLGREVEIELQFEDPKDPIIAQILAQKDARAFEPPEEYEDLKSIFEEHYCDPLAIQQTLLEYRFNKIESLLNLQVFTLERILGVMLQLIMVEKWSKITKKELSCTI